MAIQYLQIQVNMSIVLSRSNDHVYICLFVNIEIKTSGWHIQQSGVVLKTIRYQLVLLSRISRWHQKIHLISIMHRFESYHCPNLFFFIFILSFFHMYPLRMIGKQF